MNSVLYWRSLRIDGSKTNIQLVPLVQVIQLASASRRKDRNFVVQLLLLTKNGIKVNNRLSELSDVCDELGHEDLLEKTLIV